MIALLSFEEAGEDVQYIGRSANFALRLNFQTNQIALSKYR